ncbi:hypothetical protein D1007_14299 [Hordeum vulgare]|nr:hypothetical protein D1007_14299 [Hordeum vulgare]
MLCVAMAATTPAGSEGAGKEGDIGGDLPRSCVDGSTGGIDDSGAYSTSEDCCYDNDFAEPVLSTEQRLRLAHIWVENPSNAHQWTHGIGGVLLYDDILEVRIYFDAAYRLELKLCSSDVTYLNIVEVMETQGFSLYGLLYHIENPDLGDKGLEMVESNAELQLINRQIEESMVLDLLLRACPPPVSQFQRQELSIVVYEESVVYDFSDPPIYAVDQEGIVFESQSSSFSATHGTGVCTQESKNVKGKLIAVLELEEEDGYEGSGGFDCEGEGDSDGNPFYMGDADDIVMEEGKRQREFDEIEEEEKDDEGSEEEEVVHYEGDTKVEELFLHDEDDKVVSQDEDDKVVSQDEYTVVLREEKKKNKQKLPVRRGPTTRSHSSVLEKEVPKLKPPSDEKEKGLLKEADDDGFEPLSFVLPKKRKSRAYQRPPRKWYNEKMEQPHDQLFIKGKTTFVIKKMRIEHTCPVSTETTRVSAKWLAVQFESLFKSDITTGIQTLIDACMEKYGVEVPKIVTYRAKNLAIEFVLGEHKKQYPRLRDYAQTVMDTNPGSRVVVTTLTPIPTEKIPHPGPRFHAMFYCINGAREGFLKECIPFIGVDGCFIKLTTCAQLFAATGRDVNNNIYPLAFGIVVQEDTTSRCWFLHQLKICLRGEVGQLGPYTIMYDRQKNSGFMGQDLKKYMDNSTYAYTEHKFNIGITDLRAEFPGEHDWTRTPGPYIELPEFKVKRGSKKGKWIKVKFEVRKPKDTSRMGTITCGNCGLQGHRYSNCMKQWKPKLALRKNKHVPTSRNSNAASVVAGAPTPPPRASNPAPTPPPRASKPGGTGGADRVAAGRGGARRGAGRGGGRGARRDVGRGAGRVQGHSVTKSNLLPPLLLLLNLQMVDIVDGGPTSMLVISNLKLHV